MKAITAKNARGWGKTLSYALAAVLTFASAQPAQAETRKGWKGSGNRYWTTSGNWENISATADGYYLRQGEGTTLDATKRTILFDKSTSISVKISVESAGTSASVPYVFLADSDNYGLTTSGNWDVGTYNVGHLAVKRGTYQCNQLNVGGGDGTSGNVVVIGGNDNNATVTATGKVAINKETVQVKGKGKLICQYWAAAGNTDNNTGTLVIDGGEVQHNTANYLTIGDTAKATGYVYVKNGGKYSNTGSHSNGLCVGQKNVGTLDVDNGTVDIGTKKLMLCDNTSGKATVNVKNGSVVTMGCVAYGTGTGGATITIDGGTIKAAQSSTEFIPAIEKLNVYIGDNGATFDTDEYTITIGENLQNASGKTGSARFTGGGVAILSAAPDYTGRTTVDIGTTLHVPSPTGIGGGLAVSTPDVKPAVDTYTLLVCDGEGVFTNDMLTGVPVPAGATLSLSPDGKSVLCAWDGGAFWVGGTSGSLSDPSNWANNAVPGAGTNCVIGVGEAATLTVGDSFSASSITFPADSAAVTINASGSESIVGIEAIANLSQTTSHTINVPVHFAGDIQVKQAADHYDHRAEPHITFAGGAYAGAGGSIETGSTVNWSRCMFGEYSLANTEDSRLTAPVYSNCRPAVTDNSTLYVPFAGKLTELYVGAGAKVFIGDMALDGRLLYQNYGEVVVTNMTVTGSSDVFVSYNQGTTTPGVFKFESVTNSLSSKWFYLSDYNAAGKNVFYIGAGGLNFTSDTASYCLGNKKGTDNLDTIRPWYSDFTIADGGGDYNVALDYGATFCTDDEDGIGRTITIASGTRAGYASPVVVSGSGTLKVNKPCHNADQPQVVVTDTATLEYAAGASLGAGPLSLGAGTTFVVSAADLPIPVASLTLPGSGTATIQITGDAAFADNDYAVLFSEAGLPAGFADKINIVLPDGTSENRRLYTTDNGTMRLIVGSGDVPDPYTWTGAANDGKMNTRGNWRCGSVPPAGATVFIQPRGGEIVNDIENFAPASITFGYGTDTVTISGNAITGVFAITNLSTTASHTINAPVAFADKILVVQGAMSWEQKSNPSIHFAGGVTGTTFADGTARYLKGAFDLSTGADWVANTQGSNNRWGLTAGSSLTTPEATDTSELALGDSSTSGGAFTTGVMRTSARLLCWNYGEYVVTNEFEAVFKGNDIHYCGYDNISNGKFKFEKITLSGGSGNEPILKLGNSNANTADTGTQRFYIGKGGLCFADGASQKLRFETGGAKNNATVRLDPWHGDYTIHTKSASNPTDFTVTTKTYFGTTDEGGNACTVTDDGVINSYGDAAQIHIDGTGTFVVNAVGAATCAATVEGSATLAINAGKKLTTGTITVNSGAALEAATSGTYSLGDLTLKDGATLKFTFTQRRTAPVLDLTGKTVTLGDQKTISVSLSGERPAYGADGKWILTDGFNFAKAGAVVAKAADCADWVKGFGFTDDGDLYADVKATGLMILFK